VISRFFVLSTIYIYTACSVCGPFERGTLIARTIKKWGLINQLPACG
jgi:hypothetical protein